MAATAVRLSLMGQNAEGHAKSCSALAETTVGLDVGQVDAETLITHGAEDKISSLQVCEKYRQSLPKAVGVEVLENVGQRRRSLACLRRPGRNVTSGEHLFEETQSKSMRIEREYRAAEL